MSINKSEYKGYTNIKTYFFQDMKNDIRNKKSRFQNTGKGFGSKRVKDNIDKEESNFLLIKDKELGKQSLLSANSQDQTSDSIEIQMEEMVKFDWNQEYNDTIQEIQNIKKLQTTIQKLSNERIKITFGDTTELDDKIQQQTQSATDKIRKCEYNLKKIQKPFNEDIDEKQKTIRQNVVKSLAIQIQEVTISLRQQQKSLFTKLTQFDNVSQNVPQQIKPPWNPADEEEQDNDIMIEYSQQRDTEINKLVETMNELATIFKQLNDLVIDQGTLLDRIDFNINTASIEIKQSVKTLTKAKQHQESPCAKKTMQLLITLIVIFSIILVFKYTSKD